MSTPVSVTKFQAKSHASPDEVRTADKTRVEIVRMEDGSQKTTSPGESYTIPPGNDAWVEGNEPFVGIEVLSADQYAVRK